MLGHHLLSWGILQSGFGDKLQTLPQALDHSHLEVFWRDPWWVRWVPIFDAWTIYSSLFRIGSFFQINQINSIIFIIIVYFIINHIFPRIGSFFPDKPGWKACHSSISAGFPVEFSNFPRHAGRRVEVFPASSSSKGQEVVSWLRSWTFRMGTATSNMWKTWWNLWTHGEGGSFFWNMWRTCASSFGIVWDCLYQFLVWSMNIEGGSGNLPFCTCDGNNLMISYVM